MAITFLIARHIRLVLTHQNAGVRIQEKPALGLRLALATPGGRVLVLNSYERGKTSCPGKETVTAMNHEVTKGRKG